LWCNNISSSARTNNNPPRIPYYQQWEEKELADGESRVPTVPVAAPMREKVKQYNQMKDD
jgi:hypothetical protein